MNNFSDYLRATEKKEDIKTKEEKRAFRAGLLIGYRDALDWVINK